MDNISNIGFAAPYNPRDIELIFRNNAGKYVIKLPRQKPFDPRLWLGGTTTSVIGQVTLPSNMQPGTYDVLLNLPDPESSIHNRLEYSIRLADQNTWEAATGYNKLLVSVTIN